MSSTNSLAAGRGLRSADETQAIVARGLKRRYRAETRFRAYGVAAVLAGVAFVVFLFGTIFSQGFSVFRQTYVQLQVTYDAETLDPAGTRNADDLRSADYQALIRTSLRELFPEVEGRPNLRQLYALASSAASIELQRRVVADPSLIGQKQTVWVLNDDVVDMLIKGVTRRDSPEAERRLSEQQIAWVDRLEKEGLLELRLNRAFFSNGDSRDPEQAGIRGALFGSFLTLLITLLLSFPVGVAAAVYLEEFAPRNRLTDVIEVNINNLAAVPSIVFGLLGLAVFIGFFGLPRSAPLVGGLVLTLLTLPTIIIASRSALKAVPPSIREAALGMGASKIQTVAHHVLPLAMPGMLTGAIIGMARALGESAPLLMIGMVAFIVDVPKGVLDSATALPVQVFLWSDLPERAFIERTSGAIIVLLLFLLVMNATAVVLRNRFRKTLVNAMESVLSKPQSQSPAQSVAMNDIATVPSGSDVTPTAGGSAARAGSKSLPLPEGNLTVGTITTEDPLFACRSVNVFYGEKQAIKNLSIDVGRKQVLAMIGPSGCGKSTFLRCLNRMNDTIVGARVEGQIMLDGNDIHDRRQDVVQLRARVGMVFQKPNPFPKSIYENVAYGPRIHGLAGDRAELDEIVNTSLRRAGLWEEVKDRLAQPGTSLSGGQQQRLCIARTIAVNPEVILMDEPCSALDPIATAKIEDLIDELRQSYAICIVTHSMQQAARVSQRTAYFHLGDLIEVGETDRIFTNPRAKLTEDYITGRFG